MAATATGKRHGIARYMAEHHGVVVKAAARERQGIAVIKFYKGVSRVGKTTRHDLGALGMPGLGKREVILVKSLVRSLDRDIKCRMATDGKRQRHRSRVGNGKRLRKRSLAHKGIGHVETEGVGVLLARLGRIAQLKRHRCSVRRHVHHTMLVIARHAVLLHMTRALFGHRFTAANIAHDGKQDGRGAPPPALIALPEILTTIKTHAQKLCAHAVDLSRTGIVFNRDDCHSCPFARSLLGFNLADNTILEERVLGKDQVVRAIGVIILHSSKNVVVVDRAARLQVHELARLVVRVIVVRVF